MNKSPFNLDQQNESTDSRIIVALERISQAFRVLLWNESNEFSLSPIQIQVIIFLLNHSPEKRKVTYLANEFHMSKATISDTIKSLSQKGLIKKTTEQQDSRSFVIHLSNKGIDIAKKTSIFTQELQTPIDKLNSNDKENLLLSLLGIIRHLNKAGIITIQRMCMSCVQYIPPNSKHGHFCKLLNSNLENSELRIDCAEHQLQNQAD